MYLPLLNQGGAAQLINFITLEQWDDVINRAKYFPHEAKVHSKIFTNGLGSNKLLPLHHACSLNPTVEATLAILLSYPKAAEKRDSLYHRLPIHVACLNGASSDVVRTLLNVHKDGAKATMKDGQLPLHYACGSGASRDVIEELLRVYPEGAQVRDINGWLPIHLACLQNASVEVIELLLEENPSSVTARTDKGNTPLQCAKSVKNVGTNNQQIISLLRKYQLFFNEGMSRCDNWLISSATPEIQSTSEKRRRNTF